MMAIYSMHYNFVSIHQTLKITPAVAAGVTPKLWEMSDKVKVLEEGEESWPRKSAQDAKWSFCVTAGTLWPAKQERA
jgi:hypothetical protein